MIVAHIKARLKYSFLPTNNVYKRAYCGNVPNPVCVCMHTNWMIWHMHVDLGFVISSWVWHCRPIICFTVPWRYSRAQRLHFHQKYFLSIKTQFAWNCYIAFDGSWFGDGWRVSWACSNSSTDATWYCWWISIWYQRWCDRLAALDVLYNATMKVWVVFSSA